MSLKLAICLVLALCCGLSLAWDENQDQELYETEDYYIEPRNMKETTGGNYFRAAPQGGPAPYPYYWSMPNPYYPMPTFPGYPLPNADTPAVASATDTTQPGTTDPKPQQQPGSAFPPTYPGFPYPPYPYTGFPYPATPFTGFPYPDYSYSGLPYPGYPSMGYSYPTPPKSRKTKKTKMYSQRF